MDAAKTMPLPSPVETFLIAYSESDFTNPHEAALAEAPKDCRGKFTHMGAQYWGFESKRHKTTKVLEEEQALAYDHDAHGWLHFGLKKRAEIKSILLNTKWYTGNQVRAATVYLRDKVTGKETKVVDRQPLKPDSEHVFDIVPTLATECFVECYHDGGLAQVGLYGDIVKEQPPAQKNLLDDAEVTHISNQHYGRPDQAVRGQRAELHMVGWESARTGFGEQAVFHLKKPSTIKEVVVDTYLHRLNPPLTCHIFALQKPAGSTIDDLMKLAPRWKVVFDGGREIIPENFQTYMLEEQFKKDGGTKFKVKLHIPEGSPWKPVVPFGVLAPDRYHTWQAQDVGTVTHVLYMHYPNGGIHGLKIYGA